MDKEDRWSSIVMLFTYFVMLCGVVMTVWLTYGTIRYGLTWFIETGYRLAQIIAGYTFWINILIALPMVVFSRTRIVAAAIFLYSSYIFGYNLALLSIITTYVFWSWIGVIMGIFFAGVGIVFTAFAAALLNRNWGMLGNLCIGLLLTYGTKTLCAILINMGKKEDLAKMVAGVREDQEIKQKMQLNK